MITAELDPAERRRLLACLISGAAKDSPSWAVAGPLLTLDAIAETNSLLREIRDLLAEDTE